MGKKKTVANYNRTNLQELANCMKNVRVPTKGGSIPQLEINLDAFEETIKSLQKENREKIEKFWGLNPGTINHARGINDLGDIAYQRMRDNFREAAKVLFKVEYCSKYDFNVAQLVKKLVGKVNKGRQEISDIEVIKYLNILFVIFYGGPNMFYEEEDHVSTESDEKTILDEYAVLLETWNQVKDAIPDNSINLELFIQVTEMFDLRDVVAMKKFANISVNKQDFRMIEDCASLQSLPEIRKFKQRIFPYGTWWITLNLILSVDELDLTKFWDRLDFIRQDWENVRYFKTTTKQIMTAEGEKTLQVYNIGGLEFTDSYEVMALYVVRNLIFQKK